MHTLAQTRGGLRLACADLPPTLQPHAILSVAPRPDRGISALAAIVIYLGLGAGTVLLGRQSSAIRIPATREPDRIWDVTLEPKQDPATRPEPPAQQSVATTAPLPVPAPLPLDTDTPPVDTPTRMLEIDHSKDHARAATDQEIRDGRVAHPIPADTNRSTSTSETRSANLVRDFTAHPPRVLHAENPAYPTMARITHVQGPVELLMTIDERGVPSQVQVLSGHAAFHAEAERAARLWRFEPATLDGRPVPARFRLTIAFRLK